MTGVYLQIAFSNAVSCKACKNFVFYNLWDQILALHFVNRYLQLEEFAKELQLNDASGKGILEV